MTVISVDVLIGEQTEQTETGCTICDLSQKGCIKSFVESFDSFRFNDILGNAEGAGGEISTSSNFI